MLTLDHYGLHWIDGNIGLLVQDGKVDHVLGVNMEFKVEVKKQRQRLICPHNIILDDAEEHSLPDDELVRAMLPVPKTFGSPVLFIEQTTENSLYLNQLLRLSTSKNMLPLWSMRPEILGPILSLTNVAPLILYGYHPHANLILNRAVEAAYYSPRQLIIMASESTVLVPGMVRHKAEPTDLSQIPLERVGAWHLRERMLGNDNSAWNEAP